MKKSFLIPLVLVVLGILVPVVYASTCGDETPDPPTSAPVEPAEEEENAQGEVQENQQNDLEKEEGTAEGEDKDQPVSSGATTPEGKQSDKSSQSAKPSTSSKQGSQQSTNQKANYIRVTVTIVGKNGNIMYNSAKVDVKEKGTVLDALYAAGVSCKVRSDGYVRAIAGLAENPKTGEGWMYAVNGGSPPGVGANSYTVNSGDRIIWFYGNIGDPPPKV